MASSNICTKYENCYSLISISVAPISEPIIGNYQYWLIFCLSISAHLGMLVADYLLIKFLWFAGG